MQKTAELAVSAGLVRQQRAIYHALCSILTEAEAEYAMVLWKEQFSAAGSVFSGLNQFARVICETCGKSDRQRELVQAMNRALIIKEPNFKPLPVATMVDVSAIPEDIATPVLSAASDEVSQQISTPEFRSFSLVLRLLLNALDQHQSETGLACRTFIAEVIENLPWSTAQQEQVASILHGGESMQTRPYRAGQLKVLTQHLVVWLKENLAAEDSVRIIKYAISESAKSPAGKAYAPKQFFAA